LEHGPGLWSGLLTRPRLALQQRMGRSGDRPITGGFCVCWLRDFLSPSVFLCALRGDSCDSVTVFCTTEATESTENVLVCPRRIPNSERSGENPCTDGCRPDSRLKYFGKSPAERAPHSPSRKHAHALGSRNPALAGITRP